MDMGGWGSAMVPIDCSLVISYTNAPCLLTHTRSQDRNPQIILNGTPSGRSEKQYCNTGESWPMGQKENTDVMKSYRH